jgi:uncharacterized protein with HEPN domain
MPWQGILKFWGETARQIPEEFVSGHSEAPWRTIAGLRDRVVHDYWDLDLL